MSFATESEVTELKLDAGGKNLAGVLRASDTIVIWDVDTGEVNQRIKIIGPVLMDMAVSRDGKMLAVSAGDLTKGGTSFVLDARRGETIYGLDHGSSQAFCLAFSPDGRYLASGGGKNETKIWSVSTGKLLVTLQAFNDGNWIAYTPDGYYDRSEGASKYITWQMGKEVFDATKNESHFFKPGIIAERLRE